MTITFTERDIRFSETFEGVIRCRLTDQEAVAELVDAGYTPRAARGWVREFNKRR